MKLVCFAVGVLVGAYLPLLLADLLHRVERRHLRRHATRRLTLDQILDEVLGDRQPVAHHRGNPTEVICVIAEVIPEQTRRSITRDNALSETGG